VRPLTLFLLLVLSLNGLGAETPSSNTDTPLLIIWDNPHYPAPTDDNSNGGAITILWPDGRIIRAGSQSQVTRDYIEGKIDESQLKDFSSFLLSPKNLATADFNTVAPDAHSKTFIVYSAPKKHQWTWGLPDKQDMLTEIETRVWNFSIKDAHPVDAKDVRLGKFDPNKKK